MKTTKFICLTAVVAAMSMVAISCGAAKKTTTDSHPQAGSPFGDVYEVPAAEHDTDEYFGATGIASGPATRMDVLQTAALTNAQNIIRQKMQHAYKGMIADYSDYIGNNGGSDAATHVERAGNQMIDAIVNDTEATKGPVFSAVDDKGNVTCYVGIRISKKATADKIADNVSNDDELKIRFNEDQFRQKMDESFKQFKENN